ncbi:MAG TPA: LemA family protein [Firmicutes bacterium]|nr:LemA family protein [Bacillota bacterium]
MNKTTTIIVSIVAVLVIIVGIGVSMYNGIISAEENVDAQFAKVETQLQRRFDLIPNLVSATQGYMEHEKEVFTSIADSRSKLAGATTVNEKVEASNELEGALSRLLAITENYPELKADAQFTALTDELAGTENRIAVERNRYNDEVKVFNAKIRRFPSSLIASMMGVEKRDYFEATAGAEQAPSVDFSNE